MHPLVVISLIGSDPAPRLTSKEIERMFFFCFESHDHLAKEPQQPIFWHRSQSKDIWDFLN